MSTKLLLAVGGMLYWWVLHRYVWIYMGEATLLTFITGLFGYMLRGMWEIRRDDLPNFSGVRRVAWTPWHIIAWMSGCITLEGVTRFL